MTEPCHSPTALPSQRCALCSLSEATSGSERPRANHYSHLWLVNSALIPKAVNRIRGTKCFGRLSPPCLVTAPRGFVHEVVDFFKTEYRPPKA
jgi:hypothetical protein